MFEVALFKIFPILTGVGGIILYLTTHNTQEAVYLLAIAIWIRSIRSKQEADDDKNP